MPFKQPKPPSGCFHQDQGVIKATDLIPGTAGLRPPANCEIGEDISTVGYVFRRASTTRGVKQTTSVLPEEAEARKGFPIQRGCFQFFPDALALVGKLSAGSTDQHHPGEGIHWDRTKSTDHLDAWMRHNVGDIKAKDDQTRLDEKTRKAWRSLADLQDFVEKEGMYREEK